MPHVIYIAGSAHSGSTLLDLMLGAHPNVTSVGELQYLKKYWHNNKFCTCGTPIRECKFWTSVIDSATDQAIDDWKHRPDRLNLTIQAISEYQETPIIIDSSKTPEQLDRLLRSETALSVIHLVRDGRAVAYSATKKGRDPYGHINLWTQRLAEIESTVSDMRRNAITVHYESVTRRPKNTIKSLLSWMGQPFTARCIYRFTERDVHNINGNRMRRQPRININFDSEFLALSDEVWSSMTNQAHVELLRYGYPLSKENYT
jgi:hypothetical protein